MDKLLLHSLYSVKWNHSSIHKLQQCNRRNSCVIEAWEWMGNFIPHFAGAYHYLSMLGLRLTHVSKGGLTCRHSKSLRDRVKSRWIASTNLLKTQWGDLHSTIEQDRNDISLTIRSLIRTWWFDMTSQNSFNLGSSNALISNCNKLSGELELTSSVQKLFTIPTHI